MQNLGGQTKSIMVFSKVAYYRISNVALMVLDSNVAFCVTFPYVQ